MSEPESIRWCRLGCDEPEIHARCHDADAYSVVTWIRNNGGEARYEPGVLSPVGAAADTAPRIAIRQRDGKDAYAKPGDTIVMGDQWFYAWDESKTMVDCRRREFTVRPAGDEAPDALQELITKVEAERPGVRRGREDLQDLHFVLDRLVAARREADLSQSDVARSMRVKQPTISQFENESSDPKVSTLQRYARAVGMRLRLCLDIVPAPAGDTDDQVER